MLSAVLERAECFWSCVAELFFWSGLLAPRVEEQASFATVSVGCITTALQLPEAVRNF
jgi:hypothetical protein